MNIDRALFVSAHPDDTEFGAAGLLQILLAKGAQVELMVLSNPVLSLPEDADPDLLINEQLVASEVLGLARESIHFHDIPARNFPKYRQAVLDLLIDVRSSFKPDLVVANTNADLHQDHQTVANEVFRAFKTNTVLGYTHPWNSRKIVGTMFIELSDEQLELKARAIEAFKSQGNRSYSTRKVIEAMAVEAGIAAGFDYAERFELITMSVRQ